ncbi:phosphotransferase [Arthrobacter sp. R-11]|uniref:phosphotransferase n=1 Tax=Arthrobacter sp. R-11 TaxID=3404053 RepID=UPI003CF86217
MDLSHLGAPIGPMIRVHGGFANRMYRLDTDQGSFAVKELNLVDRRWTYRVEDVFRFERAAFAAGIPMPEPISASHHTLVHRWVEGEKVPEAPVSAAYAFEIGEILARPSGERAFHEVTAIRLVRSADSSRVCHALCSRPRSAAGPLLDRSIVQNT